MILIKDGVKFKFSPGGFQILQAIKTVSKMISHDLTITSGDDGIHFDGSAELRALNIPNDEDPHYSGDAYDVRSHDLDEITKQQVLANLNNLLGRDHFYYFLEAAGTPNEHFHIQVRKGTQFTIENWLKA